MVQGPDDLIDLDRYPVDNLEKPETVALVAGLCRDLDETALARLPGFLKPGAVAAMAAEAQELVPAAHRRSQLRTPYGWMDNSGFSEGHPRHALFIRRAGIITRDMFPETSLVRSLYLWEPLTEFVRRVLGFDALFRSDDPWLSVVVDVEDEGGQFGWHFDTTDGVVSLLLQEPDEGGGFELVPYIRDEDDENYEEVARVFAGKSTVVEKPAITAGTFLLFRGRRSLHRVAPVGRTAKPRLIALFSYDRRPGMVFPEATVRSALSTTSEPHTGSPGLAQ